MNHSYFSAWPALYAILQLAAFNFIGNAEQTLSKNSTVIDQHSNGADTNTRYVQTSAGVNLEFSESGNRAGRNVIFLHGYADSRRSFDRMLPYLPDSVHSWFLSQRGHGNSAKPKTGYAPADFANDLALFMDQMGISSAVIVAHSMGGIVAQQFAMSYPSRTEGLVLISSFPGFSRNRSVKKMSSVIMQIQEPVDTGFVSGFQRSTVVKPIPVDYMDLVISESMKLPAYVWKGVATDLLNSRFRLRNKVITIPTLLLRGGADKFSTEKDQQQLLKKIGGSQLVTYPSLGHAIHWEQPELIANEVKNFLQLNQ